MLAALEEDTVPDVAIEMVVLRTFGALNRPATFNLPKGFYGMATPQNREARRIDKVFRESFAGAADYAHALIALRDKVLENRGRVEIQPAPESGHGDVFLTIAP